MRITVGELRRLISEARGSKWVKVKEDKLIVAIKALPRHSLAGNSDIAKLQWDQPLVQGVSLDSPTPTREYVSVRLDLLHPTQDEVSKSHLIWLLQHDAERSSERPKVILKDGSYIVVDGHHRVTIGRIEHNNFIDVDLYEQ